MSDHLHANTLSFSPYKDTLNYPNNKTNRVTFIGITSAKYLQQHFCFNGNLYLCAVHSAFNIFFFPFSKILRQTGQKNNKKYSLLFLRARKGFILFYFFTLSVLMFFKWSLYLQSGKLCCFKNWMNKRGSKNL